MFGAQVGYPATGTNGECPSLSDQKKRSLLVSHEDQYSVCLERCTGMAGQQQNPK